jgi:hypothetical protein
MKFSNIFLVFLILGICLNFENIGYSQKAPQKKIIKKKKIVKKNLVPYPKICGSVIKLFGNNMPDPDQPGKKGAPFKGEILIYKLTKQADTEGDGTTFYTKINSKLVKKVVSDKNGKFCSDLPIGKYSIFINDPGYGLFANTFDGEMNICPIEVKKGKNPEIQLQITHSATF